MTNKDLNLVLKGGGNFVHLPPVFSENGQYIFIAYRQTIYCYTTKTGKRFLKFKGLSEPVLNFDVYTRDNVECLCACSEKGNVVVWKADTAIKLKQTVVPQNLNFFKIIPKAKGIKAAVMWQNELKLNFGFLNLDNMEWIYDNFSMKYRDDSLFDVGGKGRNLFIATVNKSYLVVARLNDNGNFINTKITGGREFTCIKFHPEEECLLTGDNSGRVILWNNLREAPLTQAVFHWHTLPVESLSFSACGTTFYSGAGECVLVKWNFSNPHNRKYLPRLPSSIRQITVAKDDAYLAVGTADNAIHILNPHFRDVSNVQHLVMGEKFPAGITYDPRSKGLVLNGIPGHLQFYMPHNMQLLYNLDIAGVNKLTSESHAKIENVHITSISLSRNSTWMATIEERNDPDPLYYESRLKFWKFNSEKQTYQLNTSIEFPHDGKTVSVKFQPSTKELGLHCVTIGEDRLFKIWVLVDATTVYKKGSSWRCAGAAFYRDLTPRALAFSYDGSLLAISFDDILTTWLPDSCENKCSLLHPLIKKNINQVAFGSGSMCHLLVSASVEHLSVWNLLTLSMIWVVQIDVLHLVSDIMFEHMAVITAHNDLFVFYPNSPTPIYERKKLCENETVLSAVFMPNSLILEKSNEWYQKSDLCFINSNRELFCLTAREESDEAMQFLPDDMSSTIFGQMLPALKSTALSMLKPISHSYTKSLKSNYLKEFLDNPIQTMLPIRFMCNAILKSMVIEKQKTEEKDVSVEKEEEDDVEMRSSSSEVDFSVQLDEASCESISWINKVF